MTRFVGAAFLCLITSQALAGAPPKLALFDFTLTNTSPAASTPEELARLKQLDTQLRQAMQERYSFVDMAPATGLLARVDSIRGCNGCELEIGQSLGADQVAYGWVQKVSNLILNVNLVIEDSKTGQVLHAQSVDMRSNTDDSWHRGLRYLLNERMFPQ